MVTPPFDFFQKYAERILQSKYKPTVALDNYEKIYGKVEISYFVLINQKSKSYLGIKDKMPVP